MKQGHRLSLLLLLSLAASLRAEQPVGLVIDASAGSIQRPGRETPIPAAPGVELFAGDTLTSAASPVVFAFCPATAAQTLAPGHAFLIDASASTTLPAFLTSKTAPFCELPAMKRLAPADLAARPKVTGTGTFETRVATVVEPHLSTFRNKWAAIERAGAEWELLTAVSRVSVLDGAGLAFDAIAECDRIATRWPAALWTRDVSLRIARDELTSRGIKLNQTADSNAANGKTYAFVVGISEYRPNSGVPWLNYAHKDAETFAKFLQSTRGGGLHLCDEHQTADCEVRLLKNEQATLARVHSELESFAGDNTHARKENTLILFIAAHGAEPAMDTNWRNKKNLRKAPIILTWDSDYNETKVSGYLMSDLRDLMARQALRYGHVLVFVDVCRAGNIGSIGGSSGMQAAVRDVFALRQGSLGLFMASQQGEDAFESPKFGGGHGAFSYFVLDGLNSSQPKQQLIFADLLQHIVDGVRRVTLDKQIPVGQAVDVRMTIPGNLKAPPADLELMPADPADQTTLRRPRGLRPSAPRNSTAQPGGTPADEFDRALALRHLRRDEPDNAFGILERLRAAAVETPQALESRAEQLRIALEDRGQQVILEYLRGEQIPPAPEQFESAEKDFQAALDLAPAPFDEARMLFCRGRALIFHHQYDDALTALEASTRLDPARSYAYNAMGIAYLEKASRDTSLLKRAEAAFHDAINFAPYWPYPWHNLALVATELGDFAAAVEDYRRGIEIAPDYPYLPYNLALLYQRLNRLPEAREYYNQALTTAKTGRASGVLYRADGTSPEDALSHNGLGTLAETWHKSADAEKEYRLAMAADPSNKTVRYNLAMLLTAGGRTSQEAETLWKRNLDDDPHHLTTRLAYARYLTATRLPEALVQFRLALADAQDLVPLRRDFAAALAAAKNPTEARDVLQPALVKSPEDPALLDQIAGIESTLGNEPAAAEYRRKAGALRRR